MKRLISLILCFVLAVSLVACGATDNVASTDSSTVSTDNSTPNTPDNSSLPDSEDETKSDSSKVLVVYYSASGNTGRVAQDIASAIGGDLFEIVPTEIYTDEDLNWTNSDSRVSREHDDEALRNVPLVSTEVKNWAEYDTVFIGYPIWWGIAAWPVDNFIKENDFSGKTVIPFATSATSGMGQSGELLAQMANTGDWQDGQRFQSGVSAEKVQEWVKGLELK